MVKYELLRINTRVCIFLWERFVTSALKFHIGFYNTKVPSYQAQKTKLLIYSHCLHCPVGTIGMVVNLSSLSQNFLQTLKCKTSESLPCHLRVLVRGEHETLFKIEIYAHCIFTEVINLSRVKFIVSDFQIHCCKTSFEIQYFK